MNASRPICGSWRRLTRKTYNKACLLGSHSTSPLVGLSSSNRSWVTKNFYRSSIPNKELDGVNLARSAVWYINGYQFKPYSWTISRRSSSLGLCGNEQVWKEAKQYAGNPDWHALVRRLLLDLPSNNVADLVDNSIMPQIDRHQTLAATLMLMRITLRLHLQIGNSKQKESKISARSQAKILIADVFFASYFNGLSKLGHPQILETIFKAQSDMVICCFGLPVKNGVVTPPSGCSGVFGSDALDYDDGAESNANNGVTDGDESDVGDADILWETTPYALSSTFESAVCLSGLSTNFQERAREFANKVSVARNVPTDASDSSREELLQNALSCLEPFTNSRVKSVLMSLTAIYVGKQRVE